MQLSEFLLNNKMSRQQFADKIGCNAQTVWMWLKGRAKPLSYMDAIIDVTGGQVTANDFYGIHSNGTKQ